MTHLERLAEHMQRRATHPLKMARTLAELPGAIEAAHARSNAFWALFHPAAEELRERLMERQNDPS